MNFFRDELKIFNHRLEEVAMLADKQEVKANIEQYQNRIIAENEAIDKLVHRINAHESGLTKYAIDHPVAIDHVLFKDHTELRADVNRNDEMFQDMKKDFLRFVADWL